MKILKQTIRNLKADYDFVPADQSVRQVVQGLLSYQRRIVNTYPRLCTRIYTVLTPSRRQYPARRLATLCALGVAGDTLVWLSTKRPDRDRWAWRAPAYGVEAAAWARFGPHGHFDSIPALLLWPFSIELAYNQNSRSRRSVVASAGALVLPVVIDGKVLRRTRVPLVSWRWPVLAALVIGVFRIALNRHLRVAEARLTSGLEQTRTTAEAAGRQRAIPRLTTGSASVRDWLTPARIAELRKHGADHLVEAWEFLEKKKSENTDEVLELRALLTEWRTAVIDNATLDEDGNWTSPPAMSPDSRIIIFETVPPDLSYIPFTHDQAKSLRRQLAEMSPQLPEPDERNEVSVVITLAQRAAGPLGESLHLMFNDTPVWVDRDARYQPEAAASLDPTPIGFVLDALWALNELRSRPQRRIGPVITAALALAAAAEMVVRQSQQSPLRSEQVIARSVILQILASTFTLGRAEAVKTDGSRLVWPITRANLPLFLTAAHLDNLSSRQRWRALSSIFIIAFGASAVAARGRWGWLDVLLQALWTIQGTVPAYRITTWSLENMEISLAADKGRDMQNAALRAEIDEARPLLDRSQQLYDEAKLILGEDKDVRDWLASQHADLEAAERQLELSLKDEFIDGFEALGALPPSVTRVVMDIDNTLVPYQASDEERAGAMQRAVEMAEARGAVQQLTFVSNSRHLIAPPPSGTMEVAAIWAARKPWVHVPPMRRHAARLAGAAVIGDQPLTDGGLAHFIQGRFMPVQGFGGEPAWPRFLRRVGEFIR